MTSKRLAAIVPVLLLCGAAAVFVQSVEADTLTFDPPITLSSGTGQALSPRLIVSGSNLYALWFQSPNVGLGQWDLMFRVSGDGGATWSPSLESPARNLSNNPPNGFGAEWPVAVATNGASIYLAWVDTALDPSGHVFFSRSDDGGQTFTPPVAVSQVNVTTEVELTIANGGLVLAYVALNPNLLRRDLYVRTSGDGGKSWTPVLLLAKQGVCTSESSSPRLAADGSVVGVLWNCGITAFRRSRDGGLTFGATQTLASENVLTPRLATASGTTYAAWTQGGLTVRFRRSLDGGRTWDPNLDQPAAQVSDRPLIGSDIGPRLVADKSGVYVGWESAFGGNLVVRRSTDGGVTWDQSVVALPAGTILGQLFLQAGELYAIGESSSGLLFARSTDGGVTWDLAQNLGIESGNAPGSTMAVSGRDVYVAWQGEGFPVNSILLRHAEAAGSPPQLLLAFPLKGTSPGADEGLNPYNAPIVSVFDHSMTCKTANDPKCPGNGQYRLYGCDHAVRAYTNELGDVTPDVQGCNNHPGYTQANNAAFYINGHYVGSGGQNTFLNYDGHPGIDYRAALGTEVYAVSDGTIQYPMAIVGTSKAYDKFHVLELNPSASSDYKMYYLHLSSHPSTGKTVTVADPTPGCPPTVTLPLPEGSIVKAGCLIALSGDAGVQGSPHLHFEVQRVVPVDQVNPATRKEFNLKCIFPDGTRDKTRACVPVDPYGWDHDELVDPYELLTSVKNVRLWAAAPLVEGCKARAHSVGRRDRSTFRSCNGVYGHRPRKGSHHP